MNNKNLNENILGWIELGLLTAQLGLGLGHIKFSVKKLLADRKKRKQIEQLILKLNKTNPELVQKLKTLKSSEPVPSDISSEIKSSLSPEELQLFDTIQESKINMNQTTQLRQLIRESIQEYIREIDEAGDEAAVRAKIEKTQEAIAKRKKILDKEGLDEAFSEYLDERKMKEMTSEIKQLEKSLNKYDKQLKKMEERKAPKTIEDGEVAEEVIDEVDMDGDGSQLEEGDLTPEESEELRKKAEFYDKEYNIAEMLLMQKRAGIISETEYAAKLEEAKKKASAGLTKKQKSAVSKKAHKGEDIGKKGKGFKEVAKTAGGGEKGEKIAAAAMWKNIKRK